VSTSARLNSQSSSSAAVPFTAAASAPGRQVIAPGAAPSVMVQPASTSVARSDRLPASGGEPSSSP
jgi:hypothetical protein